MAAPEISQFNFYSRGIVASEGYTKGREGEIQVIPIEWRFMTQAEVANVTPDVTTVTHNSSKGTDSLTVKTGNPIPAKWLNLNSYQITPMDVMPGDEVFIYRLGDTDIYFWSDLNETNVKRLVNVVYAWPADPSNKMADDLSNAYWLGVDTKGKNITLQTSKANGEPFAYTFQLDTEEGNWIVKDDDGQIFYLNSGDRCIGMQNRDGTHVRIDKKKFLVDAPDAVEINATNDIKMTTTNLTMTCTNYTMSCAVAKTLASASYYIETPTFTHKGQTTTFNTTSNVFTGVVTMSALSIVGGGGGFGSSQCKIKGDFECEGGFKIDGDLMITGKLIVADVVQFQKTLLVTGNVTAPNLMYR